MIKGFEKAMLEVDPATLSAVKELIDIHKPEERVLLVIVLKKYIHTLGFEFLNFAVTEFLWD